MMRHGRMLIVAATVLGGCGAEPSSVLAASQLAGEYELARFFGQSLPANNFGRGTVEARHLSLLADQRYTRTYSGTACSAHAHEPTAAMTVSGWSWLTGRCTTTHSRPQAGRHSESKRTVGSCISWYVLEKGSSPLARCTNAGSARAVCGGSRVLA